MNPLDNIHNIRRIYDDPGHRHYGPVRRLWIMLEQLLADVGGMRAWEERVKVYREQMGAEARPRWDEHLSDLLRSGLTEPDAQRVVIEQVLTAQKWFGR